MVLTKFFVMIFGIVLLTSFVIAMPIIEINVPETFYEGDVVYFNYSIFSSQAEQLEYYASVTCPDAPQPLLQMQNINLSANNAFYGKYVFGKVDNHFVSGSCNASLSILKPYRFTKKTSFNVSAKKLLDFEILYCKDNLCAEQTKVFAKGETIYFNYSSNAKDISLNCAIKMPDGSMKAIEFPGILVAEQTGTYEIEVNGNAPDYNGIIKKEQFGVIESAGVIQSEDVNNGAVGYARENVNPESGEPEINTNENFVNNVDNNENSNGIIKLFNENKALIVSIVVIIILVLVILIIYFSFGKKPVAVRGTYLETFKSVLV